MFRSQITGDVDNALPSGLKRVKTAHVIMKMQAQDESRDFLLTCFETFRMKVDRHSRCRQCGEHASWKEDVCRFCGTQDPVRLPMKWLVYTAAFLVVLATVFTFVC
jgi:uncharacterized OB-fold protein